MCESLVGTWTLRDSDNFEAFLSAIGNNLTVLKASKLIFTILLFSSSRLQLSFTKSCNCHKTKSYNC